MSPWGEAAVWALPAVLAAVLVARALPGGRWPWWIVACGTGVIAADKGLDLQTHVHAAGQRLVDRIDPVHRLAGEHEHWRWLLLGGVPLACGLLLAWLAVRGAQLTLSALLALTGLVLVGAYVGLRLIPSLRAHLEPPVGTWIEAACCGLVLAGALWALRSRSA